MAIRGKRAQPKEEPKPIFYNAGDRVRVNTGGEWSTGRIKTAKDGYNFVRIDAEPWQTERGEKGDLLKISGLDAITRLAPQMCTAPNCGSKASKKDGLCDDCRGTGEDEEVMADAEPEKRGGKEQRGIDPLGLKWDDEKVNFKMKVYGEPIKFYGWWRKSRNERSEEHYYAIDIFAVHEELEYTVDSISYSNGDPRDNMKALSADICAACNRWWFGKLHGKATNLDDLQKRANKPQILINRLATIDHLILSLQQFRATAIHLGGERHFEIKGDTERPAVLLTLDVSSQSLALKGKVPNLHKGAMYDVAKEGRMAGKGERGKKLEFKANPENVKALVAQLDVARKARDKKQQRMIRGTLRQMGHKGGTRGLTAD